MPNKRSTLNKSYPIASFKMVTDDTGTLTGEFEAIVSVFGNVDLVGDRVVKGAFAATLKAWSDAGDPIPVLWSHDWINPESHIGSLVEADERDEGLWVKGTLDMSNGRAAYIAKLLAERRVKEWSFSYTVDDEKKAKDGANDLLAVGIIEVGPTLKGVNPATETLAAKAYIPLAGSNEERERVVYEAVQAWAAGQYGTDDGDESGMWCSIDGTFDDRVVFTVRVWGEDPQTISFQADYSVDDDGDVTLADPVEVELEAVVTEKAVAQKAGRVLSKKNETDLRTAADLLTGVLDQVSDSDEKAAEADGNDPPGSEADGKAFELTPLSVLAAVGSVDDSD